MALEFTSDHVVCSRCGKQYPRWRDNFSASSAELYRGTGYLAVCKVCVNTMYNTYMTQCHSMHDAVRQVCRKLDIFWSESAYRAVEKSATPTTIMTKYLTRVNLPSYTGYTYDDTLGEEGTLWTFGKRVVVENKQDPVSAQDSKAEDKNEDVDDAIANVTMSDIPPDVVAFWGPGYKPYMYLQLEQRRSYWMSRFDSADELDIGTEALIRQICSLELDINRDRSAGRSVDKNVIALNTLLGSANLKPVQKKQDDVDGDVSSTPLGVWLYRFENERPLPEVEDELKDNKYRKYVFTWMGHLCKMLGLKNAYAKLYEDEVERLRVERPEYSGDDDEAFMQNIMEEAGDDMMDDNPPGLTQGDGS